MLFIWQKKLAKTVSCINEKTCDLRGETCDTVRGVLFLAHVITPSLLRSSFSNASMISSPCKLWALITWMFSRSSSTESRPSPANTNVWRHYVIPFTNSSWRRRGNWVVEWSVFWLVGGGINGRNNGVWCEWGCGEVRFLIGGWGYEANRWCQSGSGGTGDLRE